MSQSPIGNWELNLNARQPVLVVGTRNRKKLVELVELLGPLGIELRTLDDCPAAIEVEETGDTFAANARLKAQVQARNLGQWVLGEDSGLAVDALGGQPGVYSARYAGENATDADNNAKLLAELGDLPLIKRTAHYVCHVAVADPRGEIRAESADICRGRIVFEPAGTNGFGYDPLFVLQDGRTMAELGSAEKNRISHRGKALREILPAVLIAIGDHRFHAQGAGQ